MKFFVLGLSDGLKSGNLGYRAHNVLAVLHSLSASEGCSPAVIQSSVASSLRSAMRKASSLILEPYMEIEVTSSSDVVGDVMDDVTGRRSGEVKSAVAEENGSGLVRVVFVAPLKKVSQRKLMRLLISYALINSRSAIAGAIIGLLLVFYNSKNLNCIGSPSFLRLEEEYWRSPFFNSRPHLLSRLL